MPLKRKILYIPGFDPRSEAHYKKLLLTEFPELKESLIHSNSSQVVFQTDDLLIDYEILSWHEQVRNNWGKGWFHNLTTLRSNFAEYVFKGTWKRLNTLSRRDAIQKPFALYFFFLWWLMMFVALLNIVLDGLVTPSLGSVVTDLGVLFGLVFGGYWLFNRIHLFWVNRIMYFFSSYSKQQVPDIEKLEARFTEQILKTVREGEFDEVVLVGHSVGTVLTLNIMCDLSFEKDLQKLKVVTLGHCASAVSILPNSSWFNDKLTQLKNRTFEWFDVTSGKDAVNFYKISPGYHADIRPDLTLSANFHEVFEAEFYKKLKWDFYRIHFLYLEKPHTADASQFNYQKLLFDAGLFKRLSAKKNTA